jgi:hypothetical protein
VSTSSCAEDAEQIRNLVARAADATCRRDPDQWVDTWAEDGIWQLSGESIQGREELRGRWIAGMAKFPYVALLVFNSEVIVKDSTGTGSWYILELNRNVADETRMMVGNYTDEYVRTAEGWRFARRSYQRMYLGPLDPGVMTLPDIRPGSIRI